MCTWTRAAPWLLLLAVTASPAAATEAKRVLVVHSFGSTAPPFTTHSTAFEATLTREMGGQIDLDEVSLDMARYAQPDMESPSPSSCVSGPRHSCSWTPAISKATARPPSI